MPLAELPELAALETTRDGIRIPPDTTVPLTPRVRALLDSPPLRRLAGVAQLGLVALVYPGAVHSRLEHSLGVYHLALEFLRRLRGDARFAATVGTEDAAAFVVAALLHDVGHWPYCHPIEDMGLPEIPRHESLLPELLGAGPVAAVLRSAWGLDPARVAALVEGRVTDPAGRLLHSLLCGPVDVDKLDYLPRDSLHAGVPYGRHFDRERLLSSLCVDPAGDALAITDKGRTAAEMMVFARYVMFSEVYWHHAVRSATAMLQRAIWILRPGLDPAVLVRHDDASFRNWLLAAAAGTPAAPLVDGLFGPARRLFKRAATFDATHQPAVHAALAGRGYAELVRVAERLAGLLADAGVDCSAAEVIVDAPPAEREVEFRLPVRERGMRHDPASAPRWRRLDELSPVVRSLAREQFDRIVKRVRVFTPPALAAAVAARDDLDALVLRAAVG